jgi:hypothetical protein
MAQMPCVVVLMDLPSDQPYARGELDCSIVKSVEVSHLILDSTVLLLTDSQKLNNPYSHLAKKGCRELQDELSLRMTCCTDWENCCKR